MSDFLEARAEVIAALAEYGDDIPITRPARGYNAVSRSAAGATQSQTLKGRVDPAGKANSRFGDSQTQRFERIVTLSPDGMEFEPEIGDLITAEGRQWRIEGSLSIARGDGVVIFIEAGLIGA